MNIRDSMRIVEGQGAAMRPLQAVVEEMDALREKGAEIATQMIAARIAALAKAYPKRKFQFANVHGREWVQVTPMPVSGANRNLDRIEAEDLMRKHPRLAPLMRAIIEICEIASFCQEQFNAELGVIPEHA